jgi:hypothetical protein
LGRGILTIRSLPNSHYHNHDKALLPKIKLERSSEKSFVNFNQVSNKQTQFNIHQLSPLGVSVRILSFFVTNITEK